MDETEKLRRASFEVVWAHRENGSLTGSVVEQFVSRWRAAPLAACAVEMQQAADSLPLLEQMVVERTRFLEDEVRIARRRALLAEARLAAAEVLL